MIAHDNLARLELSTAEMALFQDLMYQESGVRLPVSKRSLIQARLRDRVRATNCQSFAEYHKFIQLAEAKAEYRLCIELLTTNETFFFRHKEHWDFIIQEVLAQHRNKKHINGFKAWSAACSTGEEPYSLAMILESELAGRCSYRVEASDLNRQVVEKAKRGIYDSYSLQKVTDHCKSAYFSRHAEGFQVKPQIKRSVRFGLHNLMHEAPHANLDLILVRNVLIYFDTSSKQQVLTHLAKSLRPGGWLILGGAESLGSSSREFRYRMPAIYQRNESI